MRQFQNPHTPVVWCDETNRLESCVRIPGTVGSNGVRYLAWPDIELQAMAFDMPVQELYTAEDGEVYMRAKVDEFGYPVQQTIGDADGLIASHIGKHVRNIDLTNEKEAREQERLRRLDAMIIMAEDAEQEGISLADAIA